MVDVLGPGRQKISFGERLNAGIGRGLEIGSQLYQQHAQSKALEQAGFGDLVGLSPEIQKVAIAERLKGKSEQQKAGLEQASEERDYNVIEKHFGKNAAEVYRSLPTGGKTNFIDKLLEARVRGANIEDLFSGEGMAPPKANQAIEETTAMLPEEEGSEETTRAKPERFEDFDKGKTPSERYKSQENRYKANLPLYQEHESKRQGLEAEAQSLDILEELSPQVGSFQRLNINPTSGQLLIPALASPEAQRFVKTINDFTTKAKDSYGARVTNFDLQQFMARLPTLANTEEGRRQIIEQMKLINKINYAHSKALQDTIDKYGGIRMIDFDKAQSIADKKSKPIISKLSKQFSNISSSANSTYKKEIESKKKIVPKDHVAVKAADGTTGYIPKDKLKDFLASDPNNEAL